MKRRDFLHDISHAAALGAIMPSFGYGLDLKAMIFYQIRLSLEKFWLL